MSILAGLFRFSEEEQEEEEPLPNLDLKGDVEEGEPSDDGWWWRWVRVRDSGEVLKEAEEEEWEMREGEKAAGELAAMATEQDMALSLLFGLGLFFFSFL